jgi:hypothetical protein
MKERPILFSGPMVCAILNSEKTQTRRIVKYNPYLGSPDHWCHRIDERPGSEWLNHVGDYRRFCPYGVPGDVLWAKETWRSSRDTTRRKPSEFGKPGDDGWGYPVWYRADDSVIYTGADDGGPLFMEPEDKWRPSIHMPRWASRIDLENTNIRAERVWNISEKEATAEGVNELDGLLDEVALYSRAREMGECATDSRVWFAELWDSINAKPKPIYRNKQIDHYVSFPFEGMAETTQHRGKPLIVTPNPWVWVVEFKVVKP